MLIRDGDLITGFFILKSGKIAFMGFHDLNHIKTKEKKGKKRMKKDATTKPGSLSDVDE